MNANQRKFAESEEPTTTTATPDITVVVIGGGIAGLSCIEALFKDYDQFNPQYKRIILISDERVVKRITNYEITGRQLERFQVVEGEIEDLYSSTPQGLQFSFIVGPVIYIDSKKKTLVYNCKQKQEEFSLKFDVLCICNGSRPKQLDCLLSKNNILNEVSKRIILIRDTNTVYDFKKKLSNSKRIVIVGNGGISLELVSKVTNCEKVWVIRDKSVGLTFFDSGAAKFLLDAATRGGDQDFLPVFSEGSRISFTSSCDRDLKAPDQDSTFGPSLGPDWSQNFDLSGSSLLSHKLEIIYQDELEQIVYTSPNHKFPLKVYTRNKKIEIDCDLVALAIGVSPNNLKVVGDSIDVDQSDGGILIDNQMRTSVNDIYAAGDVVSCVNWPPNELWFQMRLWTQARQMGFYAGRCIVSHIRKQDPSIYFNFDVFTHCTSFFGYKLVLLGKFNGQDLSHKAISQNECPEKLEVLARVNPLRDYVKVLIKGGKIVGAVLVGDSGLEETIENLIHDGIDVSPYKEQLLDGTVDIEDYFD